jgi:hypothetical protein
VRHSRKRGYPKPTQAAKQNEGFPTHLTACTQAACVRVSSPIEIGWPSPRRWPHSSGDRAEVS